MGGALMSADGRLTMWMMSLERLEQAERFRLEARKPENGGPVTYAAATTIPLPLDYWAMMTEADVYARLAHVDPSVGFEAHEWLQRRRREEIEEEMRAEAMRQEIFKTQDSMPNLDDLRVTLEDGVGDQEWMAANPVPDTEATEDGEPLIGKEATEHE